MYSLLSEGWIPEESVPLFSFVPGLSSDLTAIVLLVALTPTLLSQED